jgi:HSP20 family protein
MSIDDDIDRVQDEAESFLSGQFGVGRVSLFGQESGDLRPLSRVDIQKEAVVVTFDLPGVDRDGISVTCTDDAVSIEATVSRSFRSSSATRSESSVEYSRYSESIRLPVLVDPDGGSATFKNGMIVVKLPRRDRGKVVKISGDSKSRSK